MWDFLLLPFWTGCQPDIRGPRAMAEALGWIGEKELGVFRCINRSPSSSTHL